VHGLVSAAAVCESAVQRYRPASLPAQPLPTSHHPLKTQTSSLPAAASTLQLQIFANVAQRPELPVHALFSFVVTRHEYDKMDHVLLPIPSEPAKGLVGQVQSEGYVHEGPVRGHQPVHARPHTPGVVKITLGLSALP
jgi:hypothetical protein